MLQNNEMSFDQQNDSDDFDEIREAEKMMQQ